MRPLSRFLALGLALVALVAGPASRGLSENSPAIPVCLACRADVEMVRGQLSAEEWAQVQAGESVVSNVIDKDAQGNKKSSARSTAILPFSVAAVWNVLVDFEARPRFASGIKSVVRVRQEGNQVWLDERMTVLMVDIYFRIINTIDTELGRISWRLDPEAKNEIADSNGSWQVVRFAEAQTLLQYQSRIDSGRPVPGFVEEFLTSTSLPKVVRAMREEVGRRVAIADGPSSP